MRGTGGRGGAEGREVAEGREGAEIEDVLEADGGEVEVGSKV